MKDDDDDLRRIRRVVENAWEVAVLGGCIVAAVVIWLWLT